MPQRTAELSEAVENFVLSQISTVAGVLRLQRR